MLGSVYEDDDEIFVRDLATLDSRSLSLRGQGAFFSHDGAWIVVGNYGQLVKVPSAGGTPAPIVDGLTADVVGRGLAWGADDNIYLTNEHSAGLSRVSSDGGSALEPVTALDTIGGEESHRFPKRLLDRGILFTSLWANALGAIYNLLGQHDQALAQYDDARVLLEASRASTRSDPEPRRSHPP